jgi:hypothetical protein
MKARSEMFKPSNYDTENPKTFANENPIAGPYIAIIVSAEEKKSKAGNPMLVLSVDIAEGPFKMFYSNLSDRLTKDCLLKHYCVLSEDNAAYLKGDILAIEHSNKDFKYDFNEQSLVGKFVGINLREEEYKASDGNIKISLKILHLCSVADVKKGAIKAPKPKLLAMQAQNREAGSDDLPW